jgi:glycosyltransferase involved in cell wall biosynthesis
VIPHGLRQRAAHGLERGAARALLALPEHARIVLYVGRLIRIKGVEYLIRALPPVVDAHPTARLVVVGEGEERSRLEALTQALGVADRVHFAGERSSEDVIRFMRAADVFVLPSLVEAFGIVLVEAMSCGLPIVASNVMGIPQVVTDRVNALLVPPGDAPGLADRLVSLLGDPARAAAMGRVNVIASAGYALPRVADRFVGLWEQVCVAHARGAAPNVSEAERWRAS